MVMSISNLIENINSNYDKSNEEPIRYLKENLQPEDIMIYSDMGNGGVAATKLSENKQYFINLGKWSIEEAYKAYAPQMGVTENIEEAVKDTKGRIVIVEGNSTLYDKMKDKYKTISAKQFETKYHDYVYNVIVLEK